MERDSLPRGTVIEASLDHKMDMLFLVALFVGLFSCLLRNDYNFVLIFFCYFVWQQRKDQLILRLIMATLVVLALFDFIFIFTELRVWGQTDPAHPIWQEIKPLQRFSIFCFIVINIIKIVLMVLVGRSIGQQNKAVQNR